MIYQPAARRSTQRLAWRGRAPGPITRATLRDAHGEFTVIGRARRLADRSRTSRRRRRGSRPRSPRFPRERTIVTGDFNSDALVVPPPQVGRGVRRWRAATGRCSPGRRHPASTCAWLAVPFLPIDHVYAGPGWATVSVTRGPKLGSDHYPVVAILAPVARCWQAG